MLWIQLVGSYHFDVTLVDQAPLQLYRRQPAGRIIPA
jgi:hypothetical protein